MVDKKETFQEFEARMAAETAGAQPAQDVTSRATRDLIANGEEDTNEVVSNNADEAGDEDEVEVAEGADEAGEEGEETGEADETDANTPDDELSAEERFKRQNARLRRKFLKEREGREAAERALAEREAAASNDEDETPPARRAPAASGDLEDPNPDDFEYGEMDSEYIKAVARVEGRRAFKAARDEERQQEEQRVAEEARESTKKTFMGLVAKGASEYDDFEEAVVQGANNYKLSKDFFQLTLKKDYGHKILYHLAKNPAEADRISRLTPAEQGVEFVQLSSRFSPPKSENSDTPASGTPTHRTATKAFSPPARRSRGSGTPKKQTSAMDFASFEAHVASEEAARNKRG